MAQIKYVKPVQIIRGRVGDSGMVYYEQDGEALVRDFTPPSNPKTADQVAVRGFLSAAAKNWDDLTRAQMAAWTAYAVAHIAEIDPKQNQKQLGRRYYNQVSFYRQAQGLALPTDAPTQDPPSRLSAMEQVAVAVENSFTFRVTHGINAPAGYKLLCRITPGVKYGCDPLDKDLRYIAGIAPASFIELPASGGNAVFLNARFAIANDVDYRAELTVISPEGVPSESIAMNFLRVIA